jgi:FtsP/CotA-like multicopper oxidase with cupredoxin domain
VGRDADGPDRHFRRHRRNLSFLVNGHDSAANWTGLFAPGERVRLRIINASAMTNFNVRIPGLAMTVVAADGQNVQPVETDEFQIAIAETYDVIVEPKGDEAYGFIAEAIDRSGQVRATLAPRLGMVAPIPALRERPLLTMKDMGMGDMACGWKRRYKRMQTTQAWATPCPGHGHGGFDEDARSLGRAAGQAGAGRRDALADADGPHGRTPDRAREGRAPGADLSRPQVARAQSRRARRRARSICT